MPYSQRGVTPGMRGSLAAGTGEDAIADEHGPAVFQPPHGPLPHQVAIAAADARRINVLEPFGVGEFQFGRPTSRRFLPAASPARRLISASTL